MENIGFFYEYEYDRISAPDMKFPGVVAVVRDRHPGVVGHHVVVDGEDGLAVRPEPGHLVAPQVVDDTGEARLPPGSHSHVVYRVDELRRAGHH